jgi:DNA-binding LacI/PurR family transcriptional regulator
MFEFHNNVFVFDRGVHQWGHWPYNIVSINVFGEGVLVARHLAGKQIKHVVFCSRPGEDSPWKNERRQGLKYGLYRETEGQQSFLDYQYTTNKVNRDFFQKIKSLISQGSTALVTENDEVAVDVLEAAAKQGLKAGDDYSLIGFDDNARYQSYNLTTVSPCLERIGQTLAGMISQSVDSNVENADVICTRVNSELKVRATG